MTDKEKLKKMTELFRELVVILEKQIGIPAYQQLIRRVLELERG